MNSLSLPFRKLAEGYDDYYYQREPSFWDTFADHPTLVAGGGAGVGGLAGYGGHRLGTWAARRRHENAIAKHYRTIGESYEKARKAGANIVPTVEGDIARNASRAGIDTARKKSADILAKAGKFKMPAIAAGALLGGLLAYNHFFG